MKIFGSKALIQKLFDRGTAETPEQLYAKANALFEDGKTDEAYVYLQASALKGHAEAAFRMGSAIAEKKTFGSMEDAVKYYIIASDNNHPLATTNLAICYQLGKGTEVDYVKAIQLLYKAIKLGDDMAAFNLAQTYLLGVGVRKDEGKGWGMLKSLAAKGNRNARAFIDDLIQKGYKAPDSSQHDISKEQDNEAFKSYTIDNAPECTINDTRIIELYTSAKKGSVAAKKELMELGGNQMNREAMNALRKLGLIVEDVSDDFKRETIEYIASAWKTFNVEPLYIIAAWTYPGFIYREYRDNKVLFETTSDDKFIEHIANEMSNCRKRGVVLKFRLREVNTSSSYCVDVYIQDVSLSSFYLDIKNGHFLGVFRVYEDLIS